MKVLVVDDSATTRKIIIKHLSSIGITDIVQAADGAEALAKTKEHNDLDLILSDWNMPEMNGLQFLQQFRQDTSKKHIPFLMVTTEAEKSSVVTALKAGANNYILKPFTSESLLGKIEQTLKKLGKSLPSA